MPTDGADTGTLIDEAGGVDTIGPITGGVKAEDEDGLGVTTGGTALLEEVLTGPGLATTLEAPTRGGVHRGGAFGGRTGGVCEN